MITIKTSNYTSFDICELIEALKIVQENLQKGFNSSQLKSDLDCALRHLDEKYVEKRKTERESL